MELASCKCSYAVSVAAGCITVPSQPISKVAQRSVRVSRYYARERLGTFNE